MIALLGNLCVDLRSGEAPRAGGAPRYATGARVYARCAEADRAELFEPLVQSGVDAHYVPGKSTAGFGFSYEGDRRTMHVVAVGDVWEPGDVPALPRDVDWLHVAPLLRSDFPAETLALLATGRHILLDGQGLARAAQVGPLVLDADYDPEVLRHVTALKLAEEEAEVLGDPAALPVPELLVTHGSRGTTVYFDGRVERVSADAVAADPTGAGDIFSSSYAAGRASGLAPFDAAQRAVNVVSEVLRAR